MGAVENLISFDFVTFIKKQLNARIVISSLISFGHKYVMLLDVEINLGSTVTRLF